MGKVPAFRNPCVVIRHPKLWPKPASSRQRLIHAGLEPAWTHTGVKVTFPGIGNPEQKKVHAACLGSHRFSVCTLDSDKHLLNGAAKNWRLVKGTAVATSHLPGCWYIRWVFSITLGRQSKVERKRATLKASPADSPPVKPLLQGTVLSPASSPDLTRIPSGGVAVPGSAAVAPGKPAGLPGDPQHPLAPRQLGRGAQSWSHHRAAASQGPNPELRS